MTFNYEIYFWQNFVFPAVTTCFAAVWITLVCVGAVKHRRAGKTRRWGWTGWLTIGFFTCVMIHIAIPCVILLARGGIYLCSEKPEDSVQITGRIEEKIDFHHFEFNKYDVYDDDGNRIAYNSNGNAIIVDGEKYYLMFCGGFHAGDEVTFSVLPKSRLILRLDKA